ncbi:MAG: tyrosine-type recombinase/integrase [Comamonadaceae bacterium]|nr:tyrosine-type recombinase/integrase [Comamonadaceae bacterium]
MQAAKALPPSDGLRGWTYCCLFGLLAVTGLRISEALALKRQDVDLQQGLLTVRGTKFGKSRLVPLHPSSREALSQYAKRRDAYLEHQSTAHFLVSSGPSAERIYRSSNLPGIVPPDRAARTRGSHRASLARLPPPPGNGDAVALVPIRRRCRAPYPGSIDFPAMLARVRRIGIFLPVLS